MQPDHGDLHVPGGLHIFLPVRRQLPEGRARAHVLGLPAGRLVAVESF